MTRATITLTRKGYAERDEHALQLREKGLSTEQIKERLGVGAKSVISTMCKRARDRRAAKTGAGFAWREDA